VTQAKTTRTKPRKANAAQQSAMKAARTGADAKAEENARQAQIEAALAKEPVAALPSRLTWTTPTEADIPDVLASDPIVQRAVRLTGCSFEEILSRCQLVPGGPDDPAEWPVSGLWKFLANCPKNPAPAARIKRGPDGKADFTECDKSSDFAVKCESDVRFALLVHWSCVASIRGENDSRLQTVSRVLTSCRMEGRLGAIHRAEIERKRAGGRGHGKKLKAAARKNSKPIVGDWREWERQGRPDRHLWAGLLVKKHEVPRRTVDRWLKKAGCRP